MLDCEGKEKKGDGAQQHSRAHTGRQGATAEGTCKAGVLLGWDGMPGILHGQVDIFVHQYKCSDHRGKAVCCSVINALLLMHRRARWKPALQVW